jgi:hypothetical protein
MSVANGAERQRQVLDLREPVRVERHRAQQEVELLALGDAGGDVQAPVLEAEPQVGQEAPIVLLAPEREVLAVGLVLEHAHPVDGLDHVADLGGDSRRRTDPHDRAHARARDHVDGDAHLLEHLEHAQVRRSTRATAGQHETQSRPCRGLRLRRGERAGREHEREHEQDDELRAQDGVHAHSLEGATPIVQGVSSWVQSNGEYTSPTWIRNTSSVSSPLFTSRDPYNPSTPMPSRL